MKVTDFIKGDRYADFLYYRKGFFYYIIVNDNGTYMFPVPLEDLGDATLNKQEKSIHLMRYIRKAIEENTLVKMAA